MDLTDAVLLAQKLMKEHKLDEWKLKFDSKKSRLGACRHHSKEIILSLPYVEINEENVIRNVILHEIAHALAGRDNGHNIIWKRIASHIGANPERCTRGAEKPDGKWVLICNRCEYKTYMYRRPKRKYGCVDCCNKHNSGRYAEKYKLELKLNRKIIGLE